MSFRDLGIPTSEATVSLTAFDIVSSPRDVHVPASVFLKPVLAGHANLSAPAFAFLVAHAATGRRVMFDLGPRKDMENAAPGIAEAVKAGVIVMPVEHDIVEQLADHGVDLESIDAVIWSHAHIDHCGDMSKFPASTELVFGGSTVTETYAENAKSTLIETDLVGRKLVPINFDKSQLKIGGFTAHDYFADGSLYILDVPGTLRVLTRLPASSTYRVTSVPLRGELIILLQADACHHPGILRPTAKLHRHFPCPGDILAATRLSVSAAHFPPPNGVGQFDLLARSVPMLDIADNGNFEEPPVARASIAKMADFDANEDVFVVLAHDGSLVDVVGPFPASLDTWQTKDWKSRVTWAFLDEANPAFRFSENELEGEHPPAEAGNLPSVWIGQT
ncbi:hypothetical protein C8R47DRAFT_1234808 [Mycena vitilis]|nr:hypothetical protein C8R47DRAFT_1234808 [Mycena vitilis]